MIKRRRRCAVCRAPMPPHKGAGQPRVTCSNKCRQARWRKLVAKRARV